jgi:hypothetical protein
MNQTNHVRRAGAGLVASVLLALAACGTTTADAPRFARAVASEAFPVTIVAVDGLPTASGAATMEPGLRKLTVQMPQVAGFREGDLRTIELDVKACTKYWLVAQRDAGGAATYDVKVEHEQRVYNCSAVGSKSAVPLDAPPVRKTTS